MIFEPKPTRRQHRKKQVGQSLIEVSLSMMALLLILMGILDLGRLYFIYIALTDSAAEGALYLSLNPSCINYTGTTPYNNPDCQAPNNATWRGQMASQGLIEWATLAQADMDDLDVDGIHVVDPEAVGTGATVEVIAVHHVQLLTPLIPPIAGTDTLKLTASASQIILGD